MALKIDVGETLRYVLSGGEVRIMKKRPVKELSGMFRTPNQSPVSVEAIDEAIADGGTP